MKGVIPCGCGQCMPCRINRRRLWTSRLMLEAMCHENSAFVTLTYEDGKLPEGASLNPKDAQDWLKRLRESVSPRKLRFYLVGEYGDKTFRPHYHAAVFGLCGIAGMEESEVVRDTWKAGHVFVGELTMKSASYIAGYVTKKMTKYDDPRLGGRHPEFARMSLRPGIGALSIGEVAKAVQNPLYKDSLEFQGDVPLSLMQGRRSMPLGRYLRGKLREEIGRSKDTPESVMGRFVSEMYAVLGEVKKEAEVDGTPSAFLDKKSLNQRLNVQKIRNMEARAKLQEAVKTL